MFNYGTHTLYMSFAIFLKEISSNTKKLHENGLSVILSLIQESIHLYLFVY